MSTCPFEGGVVIICTKENDPERGKRVIQERKPVLFCIIHKGLVNTSHRTLISIRKNNLQMYVETIAVSVRIIRNTQNILCLDKTGIFVFCIHGSVHCNSTLIRSNKMQQYAGIY